jgi:hypothetical protein
MGEENGNMKYERGILTAQAATMASLLRPESFPIAVVKVPEDIHLFVSAVVHGPVFTGPTAEGVHL